MRSPLCPPECRRQNLSILRETSVAGVVLREDEPWTGTGFASLWKVLSGKCAYTSISRVPAVTPPHPGPFPVLTQALVCVSSNTFLPR